MVRMLEKRDKMSKYDYSKFEDPDWTDDWVYKGPCGPDDEIVGYPALSDSSNIEYWGIHELQNGRLEVDIRRFEYACYRLGDHDYFPEGLRGKGDYYVASRIHRYDYTSNFLKDEIENMRKDWEKEYKPLFDKIRSPKDAEDSYRTSTLAMIGDSELYDSVELGAKWAAFERMKSYDRIIAELYCVFVMKVVVEIHRVILRSLSMQLYEKPDYNVWDLVTYCNGKGVSFYKLKNWKVYLKYNSICNFLKHNSITAYEKLKEHNPECLIEKDQQYENGMFAVYWINPKEVNVDQLLKDIVPFLMDFCVKVLGENLKDSVWDYDDKFMEIVRELEDPDEHFGIYAACGMSPWD